jgi:hypothetical protein
VLRKGIVSVSYVVKTPPSVFQPPHEVNTDWKRDLSIAICSEAKERDAQREMKRNDDRAAGEEGGNERENNAEDAANEAEDKLDQRADADAKKKLVWAAEYVVEGAYSRTAKTARRATWLTPTRLKTTPQAPKMS